MMKPNEKFLNKKSVKDDKRDVNQEIIDYPEYYSLSKYNRKCLLQQIIGG